MSNTATNVSGYIDYFRQLAVKHKDLLHDPATEDGNGSPGDCHFSRWNALDLVTGMRTSVGKTVLLLELYEQVLKSENVFNVQGGYMGAFTIVDEAKQNDPLEEERAYAFAEQIMLDILNKIWHDHYGDTKNLCTSPFKFFEMNSIEIIPVGPVLTNAYGWRVQFHFTFSQNTNITKPVSPGTFIS